MSLAAIDTKRWIEEGPGEIINQLFIVIGKQLNELISLSELSPLVGGLGVNWVWGSVVGLGISLSWGRGAVSSWVDFQ